MKGLYQILAEDYRDYQIKEPIREKSKALIESTRPSKLNESLKEAGTKAGAITRKRNRNIKNIEYVKSTIDSSPLSDEDKKYAHKNADEALKKLRALGKKESCEDKEDKEEVIKGSEETSKKNALVKEEDEEEITDETIEEPAEELAPEETEEVEEETPEDVLAKITMVAGLSKEEIEKAMSELSDEEKEAVKANFESIKNTAMELFPEEVKKDTEEIIDEVTEETPEEPLEECEISSFRVTRISPKVGAVMIEAQTKEGLKYITGKNFNESEKTLDNAEISTDKTAAANRFKSLLK